MTATAWEIAITLVMVAVLADALLIGYRAFFKHGPTPHGLTCGWSGCPSCTERNHS